MTQFSITRRTLVGIGIGLAVAATAIVPGGRQASAQDLAAAKQDGFLGERIDGYLGVVKADTPGELRAFAQEINNKRREEYARIAAEEGVPVEAVAQLAGQKLIDRASPGEWVLGADGNWRQK